MQLYGTIYDLKLNLQMDAHVAEMEDKKTFSLVAEPINKNRSKYSMPRKQAAAAINTAIKRHDLTQKYYQEMGAGIGLCDL